MSSQPRDFGGSLNRIVAVTESTCEDRWSLLVTTALPALGKAMFCLIVPSPDEILENYLHPRTRRGDKKAPGRRVGQNGRGRSGRPRWALPGIIPDVDDMIANMIPGRGLFEGRQAGALERWIWTGIDVIDLGLWYWMLLDIGDDFIHYWASGLMQSKFCTAPAPLYLSMSVSGNFPWGSTEPYRSGTPIIHAIKGGNVNTDGFFVPTIPTAALTTNIQWKVTITAPNPLFPSFGVPVRARVVVQTPSGPVNTSSDWVTFTSGMTRELTVFVIHAGAIQHIEFVLDFQGGAGAAMQINGASIVWGS